MSLDEFINANNGYATWYNTYCDIKVASWSQNGNVTTYNLIVTSVYDSSYEFQLTFIEENGTAIFQNITIVQAFITYGTNDVIGTIGFTDNLLGIAYYNMSHNTLTYTIYNRSLSAFGHKRNGILFKSILGG